MSDRINILSTQHLGRWELPAEPPGPVWDPKGHRWDRRSTGWERADERDDPQWRGWPWHRLLSRYRTLTATPPNEPATGAQSELYTKDEFAAATAAVDELGEHATGCIPCEMHGVCTPHAVAAALGAAARVRAEANSSALQRRTEC